jgi:TrpR-related protein YerC/YecD
MKSNNSQIDRKLGKLAKIFSKLGNEDDISLFLSDICTPTEIESIADRWEVAQLLKENLSYREIYSRTGVSITTIGRVARYLNIGDGGYKIALTRINDE